MQNRTISYTIAGVVILALLIGGYLFDRRNTTTSENTVATSTVSSSTSSTVTTATSTTGTGVAAEGEGTAVTKIIPIADTITSPNYAKSLTFSSNVSASLRTALNAQLAANTAAINKDKYDFNAWMSVGNVRHMAGDEQGAKEVWEYVSKIWPDNVASFNNLGDLYANYLKDYAKAEANFLTAIVNKPGDTNPYRNLFTLYYDAGYNKSKAEAILKKAIAAVPKAVDMQVLLARYYRDTGRTAEAKTQYDLAIANAKSQGQTSLATSIQTERDAI